MGRVSMPQGKGSQMHNRREYEKYGKPIPDNIDLSRKSENVVLIDKDIKEAYREIFGAALKSYNSKQKRSDRKIEDYCEHIKKSKNGEKLFYEDVVQWGSKDDFKNPETRERAKEALVKYVEGFEERNPNLKLIGAYIHMDEASPHLHLDYVPVAHGYSRGLETRNSLDKAMKEMGFKPKNESRRNNATKLWKENERAVFGQICRDFGLEVEAERQARGSMSVAEYKDARDKMIGKIENEADEIISEARLEASEIVSEARKEVKDIETSMIPLNAEFKAKRAYIRDCDEISDVSMMYPPEAQISEKGLFHKRKYVTVPAEIWEAKHVSANEKSCLKKAEAELDRGIERMKSTDLAQENAQLARENAQLQSRLDYVSKERDAWKSKYIRLWKKLYSVLKELPTDIVQAFTKLWKKDHVAPQQRKKGPSL